MNQATKEPKPNSIDKYLKLIGWLKKRYSKDGMIQVNLPGGEPTRYTLLEWAAAEKYLKCYQHSMRGAVRDFMDKAKKHHASPFDLPILERYNAAKYMVSCMIDGVK